MYNSLILKKQKKITTSSYKKYIYAFVATVFCLLTQLALKPVFGYMQYFLLFPLVFIVASLGGIGPALIVICVGGLGANQFLVDPLTLDSNKFSHEISFAKFLIFSFSTIAGSLFIHKIYSLKQNLEKDIEDLKEKDKQFKILADSSPVLIWMTNSDKEITWFNKNWRSFTGKDLETLLEINPLDLIMEDDRKRVLDSFNMNFNQRKEYKCEYRLLNEDGTYRWLLCNAVPMYNENLFVGYVGVCVDIHEHKLAEEKIKKAVEARDHFLSVASHELKTPISSLTLQAQVFQRILDRGDSIPREQSLKIAQQITRQVFRLDRLIDDMLDNSRINSGKFTLNIEKFNLCEVILESISRVKDHFLNYKNNTYTIHFYTNEDCKNLSGYWDKIKIEQVITNLLTNAIKYGESKDIVVYANLIEERARIIVEDQGIGITSDNYEKIFNRFFRVQEGENSGLGLGLFITKEIVKSHGGKIWVESEIGRGSKFIVELPIKIKDHNNLKEDENE